jgi:hypothetical protein
VFLPLITNHFLFLKGFSSLPLLIFALFCAWLPESARFHLASGQPDMALETLKRISLDNKIPLPEGMYSKAQY